MRDCTRSTGEQRAKRRQTKMTMVSLTNALIYMQKRWGLLLLYMKVINHTRDDAGTLVEVTPKMSGWWYDYVEAPLLEDAKFQRKFLSLVPLQVHQLPQDDDNG
jgi:hypothetical protein